MVIVGGGFGGLACAQALGNGEAEVTVIDRRNHNLFQPLLYQVATAALSPADIAEPIRRTLGRFENIRVMLAEVTGIDTLRRLVKTEEGISVPYDTLVIAIGSVYNYFGHDEWRDLAPGLKTIHEARQIRQRLLTAFERAELAEDPEEKKALLTCVVIGGGPTGVEMAGAIAELGRFMITHDFRALASDHFSVILVEAGPRILAQFPEKLTDYARQTLEKAGVTVRTGEAIEAIAADHVVIAGRTLRTGCVVWGAGVKASPAARWLGVEPGPGGRLPVEANLAVKGVDHVYALGDTALGQGEDGKALPALAQVAKQQGHHLGRELRRIGRGPDQVRAFHFHNRGNTAVIGRNSAIFDFGRWTLKGRLAWFLWALVHVYLLVNFEKKLLVSIQWLWRYLTRQRGARIIDEEALGLEVDRNGQPAATRTQLQPF
ncbi:pyridine nucleotide-disulfide oxidoreductase [Xaviernesmea oryzae]|uniref:NADH:ubiquinone reductase (non-electrogenic) n=1 Tax=Xaviernesmea oryzae TaxID=464029 RepID=A0A1Q9B322_9HYPH|nr:pyridine nucleotide-disulfide oxidoreductase [Xaviernesmea oryzae]